MSPVSALLQIFCVLGLMVSVGGLAASVMEEFTRPGPDDPEDPYDGYE